MPLADNRVQALKSSLQPLVAFLRDRGLPFRDVPVTFVTLILLRRIEAFQRANRHPHLYEPTISSTVAHDAGARGLQALSMQSNLCDALTSFVSGLSSGVRETLTLLEFDRIVRVLSIDDLRGVLQRLAEIDLSDETFADGVVADVVDDLMAQFGEHLGFAQFHTPRDVVTLMSELLIGGTRAAVSNSSGTRVIDPCCGTGGLLVTAVAAIERNAAVRDIVAHDVARMPVGLTRARLLLRFPERQAYESITQADSLAKIDDGPFDYIVANPPFGVRIERPAEDEDRRGPSGKSAGLERVNGELLFLHDAISKMRLNTDGGARAVVITSAAALFSAGQREVAIRRALLERDCVEAIVELPARAFAATAITTFVWVLSNRKPPARSGRLLLVDASAYHRTRRGTARKAVEMDPSHIDDIVRTISTGAGNDVWIATTAELLTRADAAIPVPRRYAERESLKQYIEQVGAELVPLRDLAITTLFGRRKTPFDDAPNAIYVPLVGTPRVVTSAASLTAQPENYAQVILNDGRALAPYVAEFLNSDRGKRLRQQFTTGVLLPRITRPAFDELSVVVPSVAKQAEAIEINTRLTDAISSFDELRTRLWRGDLAPSEVSARLPEVREQAFSEFIETLPYPIATILWRYNTAQHVAERIDHLLNFFEALAALYCTLLLSIAERDPAWLDRMLRGIRGLEKPTFGTWVALARRLAPALLGLVNGTEADRRRMTLLFGGDEPSVPRRLLASEILDLLSTAKVHRNERAHGGIKTEGTNARAHRLLEGLLATFRSHGAIWRDIALIRPGRGSKRRSRHTYDAAVLTGTRTPFVKQPFETHVALDAEEIYALFPNAEPIQLVPLLWVTGTEEAESCHFFSRIQDGRARFVSYHSAITPDDSDRDGEVLEYVNRLARMSAQKPTSLR
jgi:Type I restriction-modification system methyltransferase subunit